jgi:hypothetical protein
MKRFIYVSVVAGLVLLLDAKLRIRQEDPKWRADELLCCAETNKPDEFSGQGDAEDEVRALNNDIINKYDSGVYQAKWAPERQRMLEIQSHLGHTVPETDPNEEDDTFDPSY